MIVVLTQMTIELANFSAQTVPISFQIINKKLQSSVNNRNEVLANKGLRK